MSGCGNQLRVAFGGAAGLDFGAIMQVAAARGADLEMIADVLPAIEGARLTGLQEASGA